MVEQKVTKDWIRALPKVELHCHLDGSLTKECVQELVGREVSWEELQADFDCDSLKTYLDKFDLPLSGLQTEGNLKKAVLDVVKQAQTDGVSYMEIRFAPLLHTNQGLDCERVLGAVCEGVEEAMKRYKTKAQILACAMRHHTEAENKRMLEIAADFFGKGLCGMDLAGNEAAFPMKQFSSLFCKVHEKGIPITLHAGECGSVENVLDSISCGASRIGHGIALSGHEEAMRLCVEKGIGIEMCPTSNLQTKAVASWDAYPILEFLNYGLCVTINTDNRTVSGTTLTEELWLLHQQFGLDAQTIVQLQKNAWKASFAPEEWKI